MKKIIILSILSIFLCFSCSSNKNIPDVGQDFGPIYYHGTTFNSYSDNERFYFNFEVIDTTITLTDPATHSTEPLIWDRAEIFISPKECMDKYYCIEIDPNGVAMDYMTMFYRDFHYDWHFSTLKTNGHITDKGYYVEGNITMSELESLGFNLDEGFYMGLFKGDRHGETIDWYSFVAMPEGEPDFHKPGVMFKCIMTSKRIE